MRGKKCTKKSKKGGDISRMIWRKQQFIGKEKDYLAE